MLSKGRLVALIPAAGIPAVKAAVPSVYGLLLCGQPSLVASKHSYI